jgi:hypothetical protein
LIGKAQEEILVFRTDSGAPTDLAKPIHGMVRSTAMVNHGYPYWWDRSSSPFHTEDLLVSSLTMQI